MLYQAWENMTGSALSNSRFWTYYIRFYIALYKDFGGSKEAIHRIYMGITEAFFSKKWFDYIRYDVVPGT